MRVSSTSRGGAAAALHRPGGGGVRRVVDAVSSLFAPRDTIDFTPVDGVYRLDNDAAGARRGRARVEASTRIDSHRLYNARAGTDYIHIGPKGVRVDVIA